MKHTIGISVFAIMCIIVWWSITDDYSVDKQLQQSKKIRYVELFMNELELISMDENGKPGYVMTGTHLQRYNNSDITEVEEPVLHLLQQKKQWRISADNAELNNKKNTILLVNNVIMQQQNIEPAVTMRTKKMLIHTKTQIAQTKARVDVSQGNSKFNANGMIYNNLTSELELLSNVNGFYIPYDAAANE